MTTTENTYFDAIKNLLDQNERKEIHGLIISVSNTGMSKRIKFFVTSNGYICDISYSVAKLLGYQHNHKGVLVKGLNTDLVHDTVYHVSRILYGDGKVIKNIRL